MYYACDYDQVSLWACKLEKANAQEFVREPISNLQHWLGGSYNQKTRKTIVWTPGRENQNRTEK